MAIIMIVMGMILWILCGFLAFLIEAKIERHIKFDDEAREEFKYCILLGLISLIIILFLALYKTFEKDISGGKRFDEFMSNLMLSINSKDGK